MSFSLLGVSISGCLVLSMFSWSAALLEEGRHQRSSRAKAEQLCFEDTKIKKKMDSKFKKFIFVTIATALLFSTCDSFRTVKLGGKDCTFKGEKVGKKI